RVPDVRDGVVEGGPVLRRDQGPGLIVVQLPVFGDPFKFGARSAAECLVGDQTIENVRHDAGRVTRNSVRPPPGRESTAMSPSCQRTMRRAMSRPRPVPWPIGFVVKNGSKMRFMFSAGIPGPSSTMRTTTFPGASARALIETRPCSPIESRAFSNKLDQTWFNSPPYILTGGRSRGTSRVTVADFAPAFAASTATVSARGCAMLDGSATDAPSH